MPSRASQPVDRRAREHAEHEGAEQVDGERAAGRGGAETLTQPVIGQVSSGGTDGGPRATRRAVVTNPPVRRRCPARCGDR